MFFDGGCRPNPGAMECAVVLGGEMLVRTDLGHGSSHEAEWLALVEGLRVARSHGLADVVLLGDALAVIAVVNGKAKPVASAAHHLATFRELATDARVSVRYVRRAQNLAGVALNRRHPR
ncbi:ribonuclease HI [Novosphingobium sp.]|uniref:ribonuclease HI n=1 Tax=Novosphingobium sp. TaxID=1874826 RepID=UPI0038B88770